MSRPLQKLQRFFRELKRRNVYQVAATYAVVGFVLIQAADLIFPALNIPSWAYSLVVVLILFGLPIAVVLAWAFEMTPEGVRRTPEAKATEKGTSEAGGGLSTGYKLLVGIGLVGAAVAGGWYLTGGGSTPVSDRSVAVLPFEAQGQEEAGPFTAGMHAALSNRLGNVSDLKVSPSRAVQAFEDTALSMAEIARQLGVAWMVSGSVQTTEDEVQVIVELVDPATGTQQWSDEYTRSLTAESLFDLQSEISREIAVSLEVELTPEEAERVEHKPTENLDAYRLYVQGRRLLDRRTAASIRKAMDLFDQALREDSTYALAWSGLADARGLYPAYSSDSVGRSASAQERAARRALELNPELAEAHASLGLVHRLNRDAPAALRELRRTVELKPSYAQAHNWLGDMLVHIGRPRQGLKHVTLAIELDPGNPAFWDELFRARIANRDYEGALRAVDEWSGVDSLSATNWLAATALAHLEDWTGVRERVRRVLADSLSIDTAPYYTLALADVGTGDTTSARARLRAMQEREEEPGLHAWIAVVQEALGQREAALGSFRQAVETATSYTIVPQILRHYYPERLASLRSDRRFAQLIREINQRWGLNPDGSLPDSVDVAFETQSDE